MPEQLQALLDSLATRNRKSRWGIGTAHTYLADMIGCLTGGACPVKLFDLTSEAQWAEFIEKSKAQLTFCADDLEIKGWDQSTTIPSGAVAVFDHWVTSTRKDRDGDILESKGAELDPRAPLLWQHLPPQPIGKVLEQTEKTSDHLAAKSAIADTALGRDAATLAEFGALRISHGFDPKEFEPLKGKDAGWHIKKFEIQEVSLVSVPSNVDAVITQFSRGKLHHPAVKGWAQGLFEKRAPVSGWTKEADPKLAVKVDFDSGKVEITTPEKTVEKSCTCSGDDRAKLKSIVEAGTLTINEMREALGLPAVKTNEAKSREEMLAEHAMSDEKGAYAAIHDSHEDIANKLRDKLPEHMKCHGIKCGYCSIVGLRSKDAIVNTHSYEDGDGHYSVGWHKSKGEPVWNGAPKKVELRLHVHDGETGEEKGKFEQFDRDLFHDKAGRALSAKHEKCLKDACAHMKCAMGHLKDMDGDMNITCHTMVSKAHDLTQQVLSGNQKPTEQSTSEEQDYERSAESLAADFTAAVLKEGADLESLDRLVQRMSGAIESARQVKEDALLRDELAALV